MRRNAMIGCAALLAAAVGVTGCSTEKKDGGGGGQSADAYLAGLPDGSPDTPERLVEFSYGSAPNIYVYAWLPIFAGVIDGDPCPAISTDEASGKTVYEGGCTDGDGKPWSGRAEMTPAGDGHWTLSYDGYGYEDPNPFCDDLEPGESLNTRMLTTGSFDVDLDTSSPGGGSFDGSAVVESRSVDSSCAPEPDSRIGFAFSGDVVNGPDANDDGDPDYSTWNGSGSYGNDLYGKVEIATTDERVDGSSVGGPGFGATECLSEAHSGQTEITGGGHTAVILYDGGTDCDEEGTVTWTLDGVDQGEVSGVACSVTGLDGPALGSTLLGVVSAALLVARRKR